MIEPVVAAIREHVLLPQSAEEVPPARRLWLDPDRAPIDAHPSSGDVVALSSTPVNPEIGPATVLHVRHTVLLAIRVESGSIEDAEARRGPIVLDLIRRACLLDWPNLDLGEGQEVTDATWAIDYADLEGGQLAAFATVTFTVLVEWTL